MASLAGVLSLDKDWSPHPIAERLAKDACRYPDLFGRIVCHDSQFSCYVIEKRMGNSQSIVVPLSDTETMVFVGQIADPEFTHKNFFSTLPFPYEDSLFNLDGFWISMTYDHVKKTLRFITDLLGVAWLYVARFDKGFIFCSDFGALVSNYPGTLTVDYESLLVILGLNYAPDNATCFKEVSVLPGGSVIDLDEKGEHRIRQRPIEYGDRHAALTKNKKYELLDSVLEKSVMAWCRSYHSDLVISLSGGYDSRYGLALLHKHFNNFPCITFGHPRSSDVKMARSLCETLGLQFSHLNVCRTSWEVWKRCIELLGSTGGYQFACGWADDWVNLLSKNGVGIVLGFLGDSLSGKHLKSVGQSEGNWLDNWEQWSLDEGWAHSSLLKPHAKTRLVECLRDRFAEVCRETTFAFPHQRAMHLDLFGRQRRFVASQINLLSMSLCPLPFFYTKEGIEFWTNLPFEDLKNQMLYKSYAQVRYPDLFKQQSQPTLYQRGWGALKNEVIKLLPVTKPFLSPTELDDGEMLLRNRGHIIRIVEQSYPLVEHFFDTKVLLKEIQAFPNSKQLNAVRLMRVVNLLILLNLPDKCSMDKGP